MRRSFADRPLYSVVGISKLRRILNVKKFIRALFACGFLQDLNGGWGFGFKLFAIPNFCFYRNIHVWIFFPWLSVAAVRSL